MNYQNLFYFDIETVSKYKNLSDFQKNDKRGYDLFMRKIERKSERFIEWKIDPEIIYKQKAGIMPEFGKIVCISMAYYRNNEVKMKSVFDDDEEKLIKETHKIFKNISDNTTFGLSGYYIKGFDIPFINRKMLKYELEIPRNLKTYNIKPWDMNVYDLAEIWRFNGTLENSSFDEMLYELNIKSPKIDINGGDVYDTYWVENDLERIKTYCERDVEATINAAKKISHLI
jgi:predicted PolB exonuclease-like 3'-5' exonuclease